MASEREVHELVSGSDALESKPQLVGSIPTKVIKSCKRSTTGSLVYTSESSSDSEEENVSRKRAVQNLESFNATRSKVIKMTPQSNVLNKESVIKVTPLRPVCSVYMVCYGQDEPIDKMAPSYVEQLDEPIAGLEIDVHDKSIPMSENIPSDKDELNIKPELEQYIFDTRYKTVWHSPSTDHNGKPIELTVPFTTNSADIFSNFTSSIIPPDIKQKTYNFAVQRAEQLVEFKHIFSLNNPHVGCRSSPQVKLPITDTCIVSSSSCPELDTGAP